MVHVLFIRFNPTLRVAQVALTFPAIDRTRKAHTLAVLSRVETATRYGKKESFRGIYSHATVLLPSPGPHVFQRRRRKDSIRTVIVWMF